MFRADSIPNEADWTSDTGDDVVSYREIDRALRRLAKQRAGLDAEEARWLRLAEAQNAWRKLGYVHALEYLEDVLGYAPRTATERLRVARELGELSEIDAALRAGELSYSVVRELTRVATPETQARWVACARGKNLRQVEQMVAGKRKGADPDDRPDPNLVKHGVWMDLDAESFAIWRQLRQVVEAEQGSALDDKAFVIALGRRVFSGDAAEGDATAHSNGPGHMIHVMKCSECRRAWQDGAGVRVEIDEATLERAECDGIICDDENGGRAKRSIPPVTLRKVMERDEHSCRVPGCRASRNLDVHHVIHRANGGTNDLSNLVLLCGGHHKLHHDGLLEITGRAPDELVFIRDGERIGGTTNVVPTHDEPHAMLAKHAGRGDTARSRKIDRKASRGEHLSEGADVAAMARAALQQAGYTAAIAKRAVDVARPHGATDNLADLIREALQHCK